MLVWELQFRHMALAREAERGSGGMTYAPIAAYRGFPPGSRASGPRVQIRRGLTFCRETG